MKLLRPITTGENNKLKLLEFLAIACNLLKAQVKVCVEGTKFHYVDFGFTSDCLKNWHWILSQSLSIAIAME